jgi:beta-galactosidase
MVQVHPQGLQVSDGAILPLYGGAMHYFRHSPEDWGAGIAAMKAMGLNMVDIYVPWGIHERGPGDFDFGKEKPWLNVRKFVEMCGAAGLYVVLRPGPHINAELTHFGLPERVIWLEACQARTPKGNPVMLPMIPLAFPVPSYASDVFHEETASWFAAVGKELSDLQHPNGPIVMLQVDNEGAMYFRDGAYDQDYHPDAQRAFREFVRAEYVSVAELRKAWGDASLHFAGVEPPKRFAAEKPEDLVRHLDWVEFHEELIAQAMKRFRTSLEEAGFNRVPTMHNMPLGEAATALNPTRVGRAIDIVALDYYHHASPEAHAMIARRTTELTSRSEGVGQPAYSAEMGAGFPPFFAPIDEKDSLYTLLSALAYGLRGFSLYMAVDRDRWIGAPIDVHGTPRPFADAYASILLALDRVQFHSLRRRIPVRLVVPRSLRRLARAAHAFGPITPAAFHISGADYMQSCFEEDFGLGVSPMNESEGYLRAFERALTARGVPYAYAGGESLTESTKGAAWVICGLAGGVKPAFMDQLRAIAQQGTLVTIGPAVPERDGHMQLLKHPHRTEGLELEPLFDLTQVDRLVGRRIEELDLPAYAADSESVHVAVHENADGQVRVVFVMNPTSETRTVSLALFLPEVEALTDLQDSAKSYVRTQGGFSLTIAARTVRMLTPATSVDFMPRPSQA